MNANNYLKLETVKQLSNIYIYIGIFISMIMGGGIIYSIHSLNGPFDFQNVIGLYSSIIIIVSGIFSAKLFAMDLQYGVIQVLFSDKKARKNYVIVKFIISLIFGIIISIGCMLVYILNGIVNNQNLSMKIIALIFIHYIIFSAFYSILIHFISLFIKKAIPLFIITLLLILVIPNIVSMVLKIPNLPNYIVEIIINIPLYSLPINIGFIEMSLSQILITVSVTVLLLIVTYSYINKIDY
ncbi:hypothetical protein BU068_02730 [Staphylococcus succinus]|uniref:hypothetical protein n=1 Tax=Staphylococcus succinus TaxID=61015 RepID=UPI000E67FAEF|nr:hypothetical protein [Staphylococcus succinus]RIN36944.1 hypothetical protein BU068_02730 [Staphylococcus succinus]